MGAFAYMEAKVKDVCLFDRQPQAFPVICIWIVTVKNSYCYEIVLLNVTLLCMPVFGIKRSIEVVFYSLHTSCSVQSIVSNKMLFLCQVLNTIKMCVSVGMHRNVIFFFFF